MSSETISIASFCKAESNLKAIDLSHRERRVELNDCRNTLKTLAQESMQKHSISCIQLSDDKYVRLKPRTTTKPFSDDDVIRACESLNTNFNSLDIVNIVQETVVERLKQTQERIVKPPNIVICNNKDRGSTSVPINETDADTHRFVSELVVANNNLSDFRKNINDMKKPHLEEKKRAAPQVMDVLQKNNTSHRQVQLIDARNGLKQSVVVKGNVKKTPLVLNMKNTTNMVREAAERTCKQLGTNNMHQFQTVFNKQIKQILNDRPISTKQHVVMNKRNTVKPSS